MNKVFVGFHPTYSTELTLEEQKTVASTLIKLVENSKVLA